MRRLVLIFYCATFVALTLTGCIGLIVNTPAECENETPRPDIHSLMEISKPTLLTPPFLIRDPRTSFTKADFLDDWGKPDEVITTSGEGETWVYKRNLWCGWIPLLVIPMPFILPVCDGFDRIDFHGDVATRLNTRHIVSKGGVLVPIYPYVTGGTEPACRHPLSPNNGVESDAAKSATQVSH